MRAHRSIATGGILIECEVARRALLPLMQKISHVPCACYAITCCTITPGSAVSGGAAHPNAASAWAAARRGSVAAHATNAAMRAVTAQPDAVICCSAATPEDTSRTFVPSVTYTSPTLSGSADSPPPFSRLPFWLKARMHLTAGLYAEGTEEGPWRSGKMCKIPYIVYFA